VKVLVCGSRDWDDQDTIADVLSDYVTEPHVEIIHGAAPGADTLVAEVAELYGFDVRAFPADWSRGRRAGPERNLRMLDECPDHVIAFQRNGSRGTQHTINEARRRGISVWVIEAGREDG
jgi:hypothetical protein